MIGLFRHVSIGADFAHAIVGSGGLSGPKGALTSARTLTGECLRVYAVDAARARGAW